MGACRGPVPALCCLLAGLLWTSGNVYGAPQWDYWSFFGNATDSRQPRPWTNVAPQTPKRNVTNYWNIPRNKYNNRLSNSSWLAYPGFSTDWVNPVTPHDFTILRFNGPPSKLNNKEESDYKEGSAEEESVKRLMVDTSGSSSPQEVYFALSLVPLLRAQPPAARLDTQADILKYFKYHSN